MSLVSGQFHFVNSLFLQQFDAAAIVDKSFRVVDMKYENISDIGTLGPAVQLAVKYLPVSPTDMVLFNDPYSAGTFLSTISIVGKINNDLFIIARKGFKPQLKIASKIDEEGLRIPPTPILSNGKLNKDILQLMSAHPLAPKKFESEVESLVSNLQMRLTKFRMALKKIGYSESLLNQTLQFDKKLFLAAAKEISFGEIQNELVTSSGELLRYKLDYNSDRFYIDFTGTSAPKKLALTDYMTTGAAVSALLSRMAWSGPVNQPLFDFIEIVSPTGCFLNAKYPAPLFRGASEGCQVLAHNLFAGLKQMSQPKSLAESASCPIQINFEFSDCQFFDSLYGGTGASSNGAGTDALPLWSTKYLKSSVEEIETQYPLMIQKVGFREQSNGTGKFDGGRGMTKHYRLLKPAKMIWFAGQMNKGPQAAGKGQAGKPTKIIVKRHQQKAEVLESTDGSIDLQINDIVIVETAGGGGFT